MGRFRKSGLAAIVLGITGVVSFGSACAFSMANEKYSSEENIDSFARNVYISDLLFYGAVGSFGLAFAGERIIKIGESDLFRYKGYKEKD